jgi:hypothetical protein
MKTAGSSVPIFLALLVCYVAGAVVSGPAKAHGRTTHQSMPSGQRSKEAIYFEGKRFELGMSKSEALVRIAECCRRR